MTKEQNPGNSTGESRTNGSEELHGNSLQPRPGPYRSLSAKRPRDPSHRKSVSFNDVPIVHEVPSHDAMRNSNCDTYRSWTYTDATPPTSVIPSFYSSQIFSPFNSSNATAQKIHANRLSSALYSSPSSTTTAATTATTTTTTTATITPNRIPDWAVRTKTGRTTSNAEDGNTANETAWSSPLIIVQMPEEKSNKETIIRPNSQSTYSTSSFAIHSQPAPAAAPPPPPPPPPPASSLASNAENGDEKKYPYRSALIPDTDHYRSLPPYTYGPLSDSTATYTSMLSTNLIQSNHSSNEQTNTGYTRTARARSATLPNTAHSLHRTSEAISITPFRTGAATLTPNGSNASTRTVLRPTTIAFQCAQPATTALPSGNTINNSSAATMGPNNTYSAHQSSATNTNATKPPTVPSRFGSSGASNTTVHSRFVTPSHRGFSTASLTSSALKYAFAHPSMESTLNHTIGSHPTVPRPPPTAYPRSRSANVLHARRAAASPVVMLDGQSNGGTTTASNSNTNLYTTAKRNPNVRQTYGSYYMHRVLLPTTIN